MSITYLEAIREAQAKLLRDDKRVFIYGQDVGGSFGGAFKATKGLAKEFPGRVLNTPISEDAMVGTAIGAALEGMRPIVEMQFADFSSVALNQILNNAGTHYWRTNIPVPITVRLPSGGTKGSGPFHSQSMESLYAHYPGLIVMTPATVEDAYTMLIDAVAIDDPVVYCEHKYLYYHLKADGLPNDGMPVGKARIARPGRDLTIVSYSAMLHESVSAAEKIAKEGQSKHASGVQRRQPTLPGCQVPKRHCQIMRTPHLAMSHQLFLLSPPALKGRRAQGSLDERTSWFSSAHSGTGSCLSAFFTFAGSPTAPHWGGIEPTTTLPAPITLLLPTSAMMTALLPIQQFRPILTCWNEPPCNWRSSSAAPK